jgi:phage terminase large subunit
MTSQEKEIRQKFNGLYSEVFTTKARYIHIWGGRGRGGSFFGTDYFLHRITKPGYFRGYFMREIFGDIRESLWRDFKDRLEENETIDEKLFHLRDDSMTAEYAGTGNTIISRGFKKSSGKQTAKLKSIAGATHILIEEAEEIDEMDFNQLDDSLRTIKGELQIIMIFNPPHKDHWIMKRWYNLVNATAEYGEDYKDYYLATPKTDPSLLSIHSTYNDNRIHINETTVTNFEKYKVSNFEYYCTMIKGLVSEGLKGIIFKTWTPCTEDEFEALPYTSFYGLDFGFSNDPAALIEIKVHNNDVWFREVFYQTGMTNPDISLAMDCLGVKKAAEIYADCAEPKSIEELKRMGWNVIESVKGADSVNAGINWLLSKTVHYVETSQNLIKEKNNYRWALDVRKEPTSKPEDKNNHLMDAGRYGTYTKYAVPEFKVGAY